MDTIQIIIQAVSTVGFPIVMCGAMFWKINKQDEDHKSEMDKIQTALNNNTLVIQKLLDTFNTEG